MQGFCNYSTVTFKTALCLWDLDNRIFKDNAYLGTNGIYLYLNQLQEHGFPVMCHETNTTPTNSVVCNIIWCQTISVLQIRMAIDGQYVGHPQNTTPQVSSPNTPTSPMRSSVVSSSSPQRLATLSPLQLSDPEAGTVSHRNSRAQLVNYPNGTSYSWESRKLVGGVIFFL